jgi:hypothetical protein
VSKAVNVRERGFLRWRKINLEGIQAHGHCAKRAKTANDLDYASVSEQRQRVGEGSIVNEVMLEDFFAELVKHALIACSECRCAFLGNCEDDVGG